MPGSTGYCRQSSSARGMPCSRPCRGFRTITLCWCSTATCRWCARATLSGLTGRAGASTLALLTAILPDPAGYGRVIRDTTGRVARIVEHKDANHKELAIAEVNTGLLAAPAGRLRRWLSALGRDNAQGEYYLPDCIVAAVRDGVAVEAVVAASADGGTGRERQATTRGSRNSTPSRSRD